MRRDIFLVVILILSVFSLQCNDVSTDGEFPDGVYDVEIKVIKGEDNSPLVGASVTIYVLGRRYKGTTSNQGITNIYNVDTAHRTCTVEISDNEVNLPEHLWIGTFHDVDFSVSQRKTFKVWDFINPE